MMPLLALAFVVQATIVSVHDGDTLTVEAYPWPDMTLREVVRLEGIDAPELDGQCRQETALARLSRDWLRRFVGWRVTLTFERRGRYGRLLGRITLPDGRDLAGEMLRQGLARPYQGGKRQGWCPNHP